MRVVCCAIPELFEHSQKRHAYLEFDEANASSDVDTRYVGVLGIQKGLFLKTEGDSASVIAVLYLRQGGLCS